MMAVNPPRDPLERERARKRRAEQIRRRRMVLAICLLALIILIVALAVGLSGGDDQTETTLPPEDGDTTSTSLVAAQFTAILTGADSVPPVETASTGELVMDYDPDLNILTYKLDLHGLSNPSSAAIYEGSSGMNGTTVYVLFAGPAETVTAWEGELVSGEVEPGKLAGSLVGGALEDLVALIQAGNAYVSVGNTSHPVDAIRGPIE